MNKASIKDKLSEITIVDIGKKVVATHQIHIVYHDNGKRTVESGKLDSPIEGVFCGLKRKSEGTRHNGYGIGGFFHEEYVPPSFVAEKMVTVCLVKKSLFGKMIECPVDRVYFQE